MHLLLVNYEFPPIGGGAATATEKIAQSLVAQGHQVSVMTSAFRNLCGETEEFGVAVIRIPTLRRRTDRSNMFEMATFILSALTALGSVIRRRRPDALICFFSMPCGPIGWWVKRRWGLPYVVSLRGGDVPGTEGGLGQIHRLLGPLRRMVLRNAVAVVANSEGLRILSERVDPVQVQVIQNGVDSQFFVSHQRIQTGNAGYRFLFVGRLNDQKNVALLLRAFAGICSGSGRSTYTLTVVGDGPLRESLADEARQLGISSDVEWLGWQAREALPGIYGRSDCLVNPSHYEGMPNVVLEAMSCGLPIIASNVAGNRDVVMHEETGLLFPDNDEDQLIASMKFMIMNPSTAIRLGQQGRKKIVDVFSWQSAASAYSQILGKTVASASVPRQV